MSAEETAARRISILRSRAVALARIGAALPDAGAILSIVEFRLASERYAVESAFVREVLPMRAVTPVPGAPAFVLGVVHVRGRMLSVVDLRVPFGLPREAAGRETRILALESGAMEFGIVADAVLGACFVSPDRIVSGPQSPTRGRGAWLRGVIGEDLAVLDARELLCDPSIVVNDLPEPSRGARGTDPAAHP